MLIRDFGPIRKASISLRPLTVFIGENGLGKSHAAMLAHSVVSAGRRLGRPFSPLDQSSRGTNHLANLLAGLEKMLAGLESKGEAKCTPGLAGRMARMYVDEYRVCMQREIARNFGSDLPDLARSGARRFSMDIKAGKSAIMSYKRGRLTLASMPKFGIALRLSTAPGLSDEFHFEWKGDTLCCAVRDDVAGTSDSRHLSARLYEGLRHAVLRRALAAIPGHSSYFPAARFGIMQAHRVITSNTVRDAPHAGIEGTRVPRLTGVASDLAASIADMAPIRGAHHDTGLKIENEIFGGHVRLERGGPSAIPEIVYNSSGTDVPVHRASSAVLDLASFTLHLRHSSESHGVLIIEEPEAHLHPRNQRVLARHIVKLVRDGADIIITTHSSALFESVSQYLRASRLGPEGRKNALGREDLYLRESEIAPHIFKMDDDGGSVVEQIAMSAEDGIAQDEFVREDRLLNEANLRIEEHSS